MTPADAHFPVPGRAPVRGVTARPTVTATAREVARVEQKVGASLSGGLPPAPPDTPDTPEPPKPPPPFDLSELIQLLLQILALLETVDPAGQYEITSPCATNPATGAAAEPLVATWPLTFGAVAAVAKRVDALAELVQHHKDLPQPTCGRSRPTGDPVTVQFEEV